MTTLAALIIALACGLAVAIVGSVCAIVLRPRALPDTMMDHHGDVPKVPRG